METLNFLAYFLNFLVLCLLFIWRRFFFRGLNVISVFSLSWIFFNYIGYLLLLLNEDWVFDLWPTIDFYFYDDVARLRMSLMMSLGFIACLIGMRIIPNDISIFSHKIRRFTSGICAYPTVIIVFLLSAVFVFVTFYSQQGFSLPILNLITSDYIYAYETRVEGSNLTSLGVYYTWNIAPYISCVMMLTSFNIKRKSVMTYLILVLSFLVAIFSLLAFLHKREFMIWLCGVFFCFQINENAKFGKQASINYKKFSMYAISAFLVLAVLFSFFSSHISFLEGFIFGINQAAKELLFRGTL